MLLAQTAGATSQTKERQEGSPKHKLVREILDDHKSIIAEASAETGVPPSVIIAIIAVESTNNPRAKGGGLMQTTNIANKQTRVACKRRSPSCQIKKGAKYLEHLVKKEGAETLPDLFLAYNAGPAGAKKYKKPIKHPYVKRCLGYFSIAQEALDENNL